jgi:flagellar biosynthesis protein
MTKEKPIAVALHYDGDSAPRVSAKGYGELAEQIIELAKQHNIPLQENAELVGLLSKLELGEEIPQALYIAIAEIIAFAYYLQGKVPETLEK